MSTPLPDSTRLQLKIWGRIQHMTRPARSAYLEQNREPLNPGYRRHFTLPHLDKTLTHRETKMNRSQPPILRHRRVMALALAALVTLGAASPISAQENPPGDAPSATLGQVSDVNRQAGTISINGVQYGIRRHTSAENPGEGERALPWHRLRPGSFVTYSERNGQIQSIRLEDPEQTDLPPGPPSIQAQ